MQKYAQNQHKVRTEGSVCICMSMWCTVLISLQAPFVLELILNDPSTRGSRSQIDLCFYICSHPTCIQFRPLLVLWPMLLTTASMVSSGFAAIQMASRPISIQLICSAGLPVSRFRISIYHQLTQSLHHKLRFSLFVFPIWLELWATLLSTAPHGFRWYCYIWS